ncbi:hypothetical protein M9458_053117 [Cirrhinus mrigala]|uniref:Uncharacterized protein n=1 Tax=Cirrhinus mrigala TaxID=683832 RepID=A0ABD0MPQ9_CIRMR
MLAANISLNRVTAHLNQVNTMQQLSQGRSLWPPPFPASGSRHRSSSHYISHNPVPGAHFRFRVPPVHFLFVSHFSALRRLFPREVLLVMLSILSVSLSDCLPAANRTVYRVCETLLPAFCRPSLFHWTIPFERRQPRPIAWTLTTPFVLPSPHLSTVVDLSLPITFVSKIKLLQMDPTPPDSSLTASQQQYIE